MVVNQKSPASAGRAGKRGETLFLSTEVRKGSTDTSRTVRQRACSCTASQPATTRENSDSETTADSRERGGNARGTQWEVLGNPKREGRRDTQNERRGGQPWNKVGSPLFQTEGWEVPPLGVSVGCSYDVFCWHFFNPTKIIRRGRRKTAKVGSPEAKGRGRGAGERDGPHSGKSCAARRERGTFNPTCQLLDYLPRP